MPVQDYSQQVDVGLTLLRKGLQPFVVEQMKIVFNDKWIDKCQDFKGLRFEQDDLPKLDNNALLNIIRVHWEKVFEMEQRRGPKARGIISELIEWRHKLEGHRTKDISKQVALEFIESVAYILRCVDAKDELEEANNLLQSISPSPKEVAPILPEMPPLQPKPPVEILKATPLERITTPVEKITTPVEIEPLRISRTTDFWGAYHFDFADALNEEIWLLSPEIQKQVQPADTLKQPGVIGAQQAMLDDSLLAERGPLPWVPDLVGNQWQDENGIVVVGSAYAGFIREFSTRATAMPLNQYLAAVSVQDFQNLFLRYVVRSDPSYYTPIQNLCSDLGSASPLSLVDLCRVSLVERGFGVDIRADGSSNITKKAPTVFEKYVESHQAAEWLWRRFAEGQAKCVLALGSTAEHGLLRMFSHRGMTITQDEEPYFVPPIAQGAWANEYADPKRNLRYWLTHETWWTIRGQINGVERVWYVLPTYHPSIHRTYDVDYKKTKIVLKMMQASVRQ